MQAAASEALRHCGIGVPQDKRISFVSNLFLPTLLFSS